MSATTKALKRNQASDLYGMRSEFIIDAAALLASPISTVFNNVFDTGFPCCSLHWMHLPCFQIR